jgi:pimeloyl-ACP methyl ester carboxylesterase
MRFHVSPTSSRRALGHIAKLATGLGVLLLASASGQVSAAKGATLDNKAPKPTIVLVHGAWADSSSWSQEIRELQGQGYTVVAPPNPLRGLTSDAAYIADFLSKIPGPIVLVGHSYGGAVITNAATGNPNVKALVFVDAFIPDQNQTLQDLASTPPPPGQSASCLGGDPSNVFNMVPYPGASTGDADLYVKSTPNPGFIGFHACFANDLPSSTAAALAASQRPLAFSALLTPSGAPAWATIPSWAVVGTLDRVIPPYAQRGMAEHAKAHIVEVNGSHLGLISQADAVTRAIIAATTATANVTA